MDRLTGMSSEGGPNPPSSAIHNNSPNILFFSRALALPSAQQGAFGARAEPPLAWPCSR